MMGDMESGSDYPRRVFLGLTAAGAAGLAAGCSADATPSGSAASTHTAAHQAASHRPVSENALPGDPHWEIRHLGAPMAIVGYAGQASVLPGEPITLYVSTTARSFTVSAFRMGWYHGDRARRLWKSGSVKGHRQRGRDHDPADHTVEAVWGESLTVPTHDWPEGSYLLRLDAETGAQRYVPITVRSASTRGKVVIKNGDGDLAGVQHLGWLRPVQRARRDRRLQQPLARGQPGPAVRRQRRVHVPVPRAEDHRAGRADGPAAGLRDQHGHRRRPAPAGRGQRADHARATTSTGPRRNGRTSPRPGTPG